MNPGPVNVTERVRRALLGSDLCHREKEFSVLLKGIRKKILKIFGIQKTHSVAVFTGSGTAALEAMLSAVVQKNKKVLVLSNGVYGERIQYILETHGSPVKCLASDLGSFPKLKTIEEALKNDSSLHAVAMVHHETSTGMLNPLAEVGAIVKKHKKTFLVDAVSSLGAEKIDFERWGIDFCAGTAGKCLHGFPGVSFVIVSKRASEKFGGQKAKTLYLDLFGTLKAEEKGDTSFTPAVQLFYAFNEALDELSDEGLLKRMKKYREKNARLENGFSSLGVRFLVPKERRSHVLTALWMPASLSYSQLHEKLKKEGFIIYAGQSFLKDKIFRVANLGDVSLKNIDRFLSALKKYSLRNNERIPLKPHFFKAAHILTGENPPHTQPDHSAKPGLRPLGRCPSIYRKLRGVGGRSAGLSSSHDSG